MKWRLSVALGFGALLSATVLYSCGGGSSTSGPTPAPTAVPIIINVSGGAPSSFTATFQSVAMTASGTYTFALEPGVYTVSGRLSNTMSLGFNLTANAVAGGIVGGSISSSISCGATNCSPTVSSCGGISACVAPGGEGFQNVAPCAVTYVSQSGSSTCFINAGGDCATRPNPYVPLDFQFQFRVDGTIPAKTGCGF